MHLLSAQAGAIQQDGEAIDLAQTPGALIFASAADSELAMLAGAADRSGETGLRLANTLRLSHNYSVDLWLEQTVRHARIVVVRLLGGAAYWQYGVDELTALCANHKIALALLPGDANPDPILRHRSTIHPDDWSALHALFTAGGPDNADRILAALNQLATPHALGAQRLARDADKDFAPAPFARFGLWHPALGITEPEALAAYNAKTVPDAVANIPILFYRAALEGAGTATLEALIAALTAADLVPVPLVISSLKEGACVRFVQNALARFQPAAILNLTGFALGLDGLEAKSNPFAEIDAPIIQLLQGGRPIEQYQADPQGLSAKDLAMQVVMPELDGRIGAILVGHKQQALWHNRSQCPLSAYAPDASGIARATNLAQNYARLRATPRAQRKIGLILANYPIRDGRLANGVGYDAPQSSVEILKALKAEGYRLDVPENGNALIESLQAGPTNANPQRGASKAQLTLARYNTLFAALPEKIRTEVTTRWGQPEADPFLRGDVFHLPALIFGNLTILLQPARGYDRDETANYHDPDLVPPHAYLAAYLWLRHEFAAHALIHNGKHGNLEWLPGKATALDETSYPDALWGQLPHLYPFIVNDPGEGTQAKRRTGATIIDHLVPPLTRAETYGPLKDLEALLDEYYAASGMDRRRLSDLKRRILDFTRDTRLDRDIALPDDPDAALAKIDNFLCDLKEAQIRDGLHIFGQSPTGDLERDLIVALARVPRGDNGGGEASIIRALADDLKLGFDALSAETRFPMVWSPGDTQR
uniref:cobaltochelatase subunit CobN n=1 Tax=Devosia algicola TaxID=3026418 RepID=UPI002E209F4E